MQYTLIMLNKQGASEQTDHATADDVMDQINSWADPENMTARVWTDTGTQIFDGPALAFQTQHSPR